MTDSKVAVVDGANVAYIEQSRDDNPKVENLVAVRRVLEQKGYSPIVIVDASLKHKVDDPDQLEALLNSQKARQAPAGTDADYFVVETADQQEAVIVSNDKYADYRDEHPWIEDRLIPLMIVEGEVELYERKAEPEK